MHTEQQTLKENKNNSSAGFVQISLTFDLSREKFKPIVSNNPGLFSVLVRFCSAFIASSPFIYFGYATRYRDGAKICDQT